MSADTPNLIQVELNINGQKQQVVIPPNKTLLATLRENLYLTGAKPGCFNGDCGACTVMIDELPMKSCLMLSVEVHEKKVTTIEGVKESPLQKAFIENFAFQCGYCTPGIIMNCHALMLQNSNPNRETIIEWLESNICRCTSYEEIELAINDVIKKSGYKS